MATLNASGHSSDDRADLDYYATPSGAVEELLRLEVFSNVWECACGEMAISKVLQKAGITVRSSDIKNRGNDVIDFLSAENRTWAGDIITNPPFAKATEFLEKAIQIIRTGDKIAFFLRIQFLEGVRRRQIFERNPPIRIWVASRTFRCAKNGDFERATGNASTYCWFIWEKGFNGSPQIGWMN